MAKVKRKLGEMKKSELEEELIKLSYKHNNEITLAIEDIVSLAKEYALSVLPKNKRTKGYDVNDYAPVQNMGWNMAIEKIEENIKKES